LALKLNVYGGLPESVSVAIAVPLSISDTLPVGAVPVASVVIVPWIVSGAPDATSDAPVYDISSDTVSVERVFDVPAL
jgi:hypothetical protein